MAVLVSVDQVKNLALTERHGTIVALTRGAVVKGVAELNDDYQALLAALNAAGIPQYGSFLDGPEFGGLVLHNRNVKIKEDDPDWADVTLEYGPLAQGQEIPATSATGTLYGRVKCGIAQKKTNFYKIRNSGSPDEVVQIFVEHTFPADDPDYPNQYFEQGGEIDVYLPQATFTFEGFLNTANPWGVTALLIGNINNGIWCNQEAEMWMCTEVGWSVCNTRQQDDGTPPRYHFDFEFQLNPEGWQPTAVFVDQRTGKPPPNLEEDVGYKTIPYYRTRNFSEAFESYFEGWQQLG